MRAQGITWTGTNILPMVPPNWWKPSRRDIEQVRQSMEAERFERRRTEPEYIGYYEGDAIAG